MGMFTLLDAALPSGQALVRLSTAPNFYYKPALGAPIAETFVDGSSSFGSRLFGQGAELRMLKYVVESRVPNPN
jgi:hypothetical protein